MIGTTNKYYVELGFNSDEFTLGSNTYYLHDQGWAGLILDNKHSNSAINLHNQFITPQNILTSLAAHGVPTEPDYVSIDIDSQDLWVLRSIIGGKIFLPLHHLFSYLTFVLSLCIVVL